MTVHMLLASLGLASAAFADIVLTYEPNTLDIADGEQVIEIIITANEDVPTEPIPFGVGGIGFSFDDDSEAWSALNPSEFAWVPEEIFVIPCFFCHPSWEHDESLPIVQAVSGHSRDSIFMNPGASRVLAELTVTPSQAGVFELPTGVEMFNAITDPLEVKGGALPEFTIVPEPACLTLLAVGLLLCSPKRRPTVLTT